MAARALRRPQAGVRPFWEKDFQRCDGVKGAEIPPFGRYDKVSAIVEQRLSE
jgi:hypothetical protein